MNIAERRDISAQWTSIRFQYELFCLSREFDTMTTIMRSRKVSGALFRYIHMVVVSDGEVR